MTSIADYSVDHLIGKQVGTCTILKELARGSMGIVFIAFQNTLKRQVAVKILPRHLINPQSTEYFQREAETAAILSHPYILPIYEIGEMEEFLYFTMQLVLGEALSAVLDRTRKHFLPSRRVLPLKTGIRIISQILEALDYAHSQDIVHRDIKPANILMEKHTQRPIISDFGVAKVLRGDNIDSGIQGTPIYMAPEQVLGSAVDGRADLYAVGCMLFEMMVEKLPIKNMSLQTLLITKARDKRGIFSKRPSEVNPVLNQEMDRIVQKATAYEPEQRYQTGRDFTRHLEWYQETFLKQAIAEPIEELE